MKWSFWKLEMEGRDGDCGSCCLFERSGETGKRGVPGEAGTLKTGSMRLSRLRSRGLRKEV